MDNLKVEELEIVVTRGSTTVVTWLGISQTRNLESLINPFFEELAESLHDVSVIVDFTKLEYMNSSTVSPIISMCRNFDKKAIPTTIQFNKSSDWQFATFKGLATLAKVMKHITVEPITQK